MLADSEPERPFSRDPERAFRKLALENSALPMFVGGFAPSPVPVPSRQNRENDRGGNAARISDRFR